MANLFKKTYPVPIPEGATITTRNRKRVVIWTDRHGNKKISDLHKDGQRMLYISEAWYVRYIDADGRMRRVCTKCRDKSAAQKVLVDLMRETERIRIGLVNRDEIELADYAKKPIADHIDDYLDHLSTKRKRGRKVSAHYRRNLRGRLERIFRECRIKSLNEITHQRVCLWLDNAEHSGMSAATRNEYLISAKAFCNWLKQARRWRETPLEHIQKADISSDRRHVRRSLTTEEVGRLLRAARLRPLAERGRQPIALPRNDQSRRNSWTFEPLTAENLDACYKRGLKKLMDDPPRCARLNHLGRQRSLFYLLAVSTGLRRKELASVTIGQVYANNPTAAFIELNSCHAKNGKGAQLPLRADVLDELRNYLATFDDASLDRPLFDTPPTIRVFDADCQAAGIAKTDARGRIVDIHALRTTFCTHLAVAGVHPRVAQQAMRHSRMELTTQYYTDPAFLDVAGAVNSLPAFGGK